MIWSDFEFVIHLACIVKPRIHLALFIDNNDNDMAFFREYCLFVPL